MATLSSNLILSMTDRVTGPMRRLQGVLNGFQRDVRGMRGLGVGGLGLIGGALGTVGAYVGITEGMRATVGAAREMQAALTEIGIKADLTETQISALRSQVLRLAPATNQTTADLLAGVDTMVGLGLSAESAAAAIPAIGKAATATGATMADLSGAAVSAMQNLKVAAGDLPKMLDAMAAAGNAGAFELRDMATYFPSLGAAYQGLGQQGVSAATDLAAALQIVRKGTGDSSTAATNLGNVLQKIYAPGTIKKFKKEGVDLFKAMNKAAKRGLTPIEAIAEITNETLGGDLSKLGDLFEDAQVQGGLRSLIQNMDEYRRIRDEAARASGTVADAYARRMQNADEKIKALRISMENLGTSVGANLLAPLGNVAQHFADIFNTLDQRATVFDKFRFAIEGFTKGFGYKGGIGDLAKDFETFIFGAADASKAADEIGYVFKRFHEMGQDLRALFDAFAGAETFSAKVGIVVSGIGQFKELFTGASVLTIGAGAFAINALAGALMAIGRSPVFSIAMVAYGISAIIGAAQGAKSISEFVEALQGLSALEWAGIGTGLLIIGGKVKRLIDLFRQLKGVVPEPTKATSATGGGWAKALGLTSIMGGWAALVQLLGDTPGDTFEEQVANQRRTRENLQKLLGMEGPRESTGRAHLRTNDDGGRAKSMDEWLDGPIRPQSSVDVEPAKQDVQLAATEMTNALQIQGTAQMDTTGIDVAIMKASRLVDLLRQAGAAASSAARLDTSGMHADLSRAG